MQEEKKIASVSQYMDEINFYYDCSKGKNTTLFFRGCSGEHPETENIPGIYRKINNIDYASKEHKMIEEIMVRHPEEFFQCKSTIEKLVMMQHYGLPTRLLDISQNPLVSLYFACQSESKHSANVYLFEIPNERIKYSTSDTVSVIANLACMDYDFDLEKLIHQIRREKPYFQSRICKDHLQNYIICVKPKWDNARIIAQQGAFLLFGIKGKKNACSDLHTRKDGIFIKKKFMIASREKEMILKQLDRIGINSSTIYPELDKTAKYIKDNFSDIFGD